MARWLHKFLDLGTCRRIESLLHKLYLHFAGMDGTRSLSSAAVPELFQLGGPHLSQWVSVLEVQRNSTRSKVGRWLTWNPVVCTGFFAGIFGLGLNQKPFVHTARGSNVQQTSSRACQMKKELSWSGPRVDGEHRLSQALAAS